MSDKTYITNESHDSLLVFHVESTNYDKIVRHFWIPYFLRKSFGTWGNFIDHFKSRGYTEIHPGCSSECADYNHSSIANDKYAQIIVTIPKKESLLVLISCDNSYLCCDNGFFPVKENTLTQKRDNTEPYEFSSWNDPGYWAYWN